MLKGIKDIERPKLLIRWIKALLLEDKGKAEDMRRSGAMMDRIAVRMKNLEMKAELKVLLADRARVARNPTTIRRIASRAYDMEHLPHIMKLIEVVIKEPQREHITNWRNSLDAYIPPFPATA